MSSYLFDVGETAKTSPTTKATSAKILKAQKEKNDEFYTTRETVEAELDRYSWRGRRVFCPCDNPEFSEYAKYFIERRGELGELCCFYQDQDKQVLTRYAPTGLIERIELRENVFSYRGDACQKLLPELRAGVVYGRGNKRDFELTPTFLEVLDRSEIVVTNPPFSKFRSLLALLLERDKDFLLLGTNTAPSYDIIFQAWKEDRLRAGYLFDVSAEFKTPSGEVKWVPVSYYTSLPVDNPYKDWSSGMTVEELKRLGRFKMYDNGKALYLLRGSDYPEDYWGIVGVPVTYLNHYDRSKFDYLYKNHSVGKYVDGREAFARVYLRRKKAFDVLRE